MGTNPSTFTNRNTTSTDGGVIYVNGKTYTLARSDTFYYLEFINYDKELFKTASNLTSKPTLIFYTESATNKVIFDYTLANATDKKYINSFFANMTSGGETFSMIKGDYLDAAELSADLSCTVTFASYSDYKAFANVVSVTETNPASDVYLGEYFTGTPQLSKTGSLGYTASTVNYALVSVNPNTSKPLTYMGVAVGDVVEVVNSSSTNNHSLFEITEITTINNKEVLKINSIYGIPPTIESLIGSPSTLKVYVKGTTTLTPGLTGDVGCCKNLVTNEYHESSTEYQCGIRTNDIFSFTLGNCDPATSSAFNLATTININDLQFDASVFPYLLQGPIVELQVKIVDGRFIVEGDGLEQPNANTVGLNTGTIYRFVQSDSSNTGYPLRFSTSPQTNLDAAVPYIKRVYGVVYPEGIGSDIYLDLKAPVPSRLYMFTENDNTISSQTLFINP